MSGRKSIPLVFVAGCGVLIAAGVASAQTPLPLPPEIAAPKDVPFPGAIRLAVDATDVTRHIFRIKETIPVQSGSLTLLHPKWHPGTHSPTGRIDALAGLVIQANGRRVEWVRDAVDVYAFHINVPTGATSLDLEFQFLSAGDGNEGRIVTTPEMLNLKFQIKTRSSGGYVNVKRIDVDCVAHPL